MVMKRGNLSTAKAVLQNPPLLTKFAGIAMNSIKTNPSRG